VTLFSVEICRHQSRYPEVKWFGFLTEARTFFAEKKENLFPGDDIQIRKYEIEEGKRGLANWLNEPLSHSEILETVIQNHSA